MEVLRFTWPCGEGKWRAKTIKLVEIVDWTEKYQSNVSHEHPEPSNLSRGELFPWNCQSHPNGTWEALLKCGSQLGTEKSGILIKAVFKMIEHTEQVPPTIEHKPGDMARRAWSTAKSSAIYDCKKTLRVVVQLFCCRILSKTNTNNLFTLIFNK